MNLEYEIFTDQWKDKDLQGSGQGEGGQNCLCLQCCNGEMGNTPLVDRLKESRDIKIRLG